MKPLLILRLLGKGGRGGTGDLALIEGRRQHAGGDFGWLRLRRTIPEPGAGSENNRSRHKDGQASSNQGPPSVQQPT